MNWKEFGRKLSWRDLRHYPGICFEGLRKPTTNICQDGRSPGRDLNPGPPDYEAVVLTTQALNIFARLQNLYFILLSI
jgi:hypothetical protein